MQLFVIKPHSSILKKRAVLQQPPASYIRTSSNWLTHEVDLSPPSKNKNWWDGHNMAQQLTDCLSLWRSRFKGRLVCAEFVVGKVAVV